MFVLKFISFQAVGPNCSCSYSSAKLRYINGKNKRYTTENTRKRLYECKPYNVLIKTKKNATASKMKRWHTKRFVCYPNQKM